MKIQIEIEIPSTFSTTWKMNMAEMGEEFGNHHKISTMDHPVDLLTTVLLRSGGCRLSHKVSPLTKGFPALPPTSRTSEPTWQQSIRCLQPTGVWLSSWPTGLGFKPWPRKCFINSLEEEVKEIWIIKCTG